MKKHPMHSTAQTEHETSRGISERYFVLLVAVLLALTVGFMLYYYHAAASGTLAATPTPAPPTATPILDANGNPAPIHAWFPALRGESFFAKAPNGETLLVDAGTETDADDLIAFLEAQSVSKLDAVFLSSAEEMHIGGMTEIISRFPIGCFYLTPECAEHALCQTLLMQLSDLDIPVQKVHASFISTVDWAEHAELRILSPHDVVYTSEEDESLVLRLSYGNSEVLLAGTAGELAERMAVKALPNTLLHADVLKLASSNNAGGTSERFLGTVKPNIAILCGSESNTIASAAKKRLTQRNIPILSTKELGTIEILLDGVRAEVVK